MKATSSCVMPGSIDEVAARFADDLRRNGASSVTRIDESTFESTHDLLYQGEHTRTTTTHRLFPDPDGTRVDAESESESIATPGVVDNADTADSPSDIRFTNQEGTAVTLRLTQRKTQWELSLEKVIGWCEEMVRLGRATNFDVIGEDCEFEVPESAKPEDFPLSVGDFNVLLIPMTASGEYVLGFDEDEFPIAVPATGPPLSTEEAQLVAKGHELGMGL